MNILIPNYLKVFRKIKEQTLICEQTTTQALTPYYQPSSLEHYGN
jgi:hypothetical protein